MALIERLAMTVLGAASAVETVLIPIAKRMIQPMRISRVSLLEEQRLVRGAAMYGWPEDSAMFS